LPNMTESAKNPINNRSESARVPWRRRHDAIELAVALNRQASHGDRSRPPQQAPTARHHPVLGYWLEDGRSCRVGDSFQRLARGVESAFLPISTMNPITDAPIVAHNPESPGSQHVRSNPTQPGDFAARSALFALRQREHGRGPPYLPFFPGTGRLRGALQFRGFRRVCNNDGRIFGS